MALRKKKKGHQTTKSDAYNCPANCHWPCLRCAVLFQHLQVGLQAPAFDQLSHWCNLAAFLNHQQGRMVMKSLDMEYG